MTNVFTLQNTGDSMNATAEAFLKAIRSLEQGVDSLEMPYIQKMSEKLSHS